MMLEEINQQHESNMNPSDSDDKNKNADQEMIMHRLQLFNPKYNYRITNIDLFFASILVTRDISDPNILVKNKMEKVRHDVNMIELYTCNPQFSPRYLTSIIVHENITSIHRLIYNMFVTTSKQGNISLYDVSMGKSVKTIITDYGSILCSHFDRKTGYLFTGTEFGYVAVYNVDDKEEKNRIECIAKMPKSNGPIQHITVDVVQKKDVDHKANTQKRKTIMASRRDRLRRKKLKINQVLEDTVNGKEKVVEGEDSEDESEDDEEANEYVGFDQQPEFTDFDITVYGSSGFEMHAFDFQKKRVIETMRISSGVSNRDKTCQIETLLTLADGNIVVGDSHGNINIFDRKTFTIRQTISVMDGPITNSSLSADPRRVLLTGLNRTILLKRNDDGNYVINEVMQLPLGRLQSATFMSKLDFVVGCEDGSLVHFKQDMQLVSRKPHKKAVLIRSVCMPPFGNYIKCSDHHVMLQHEVQLSMWSLPREMSDKFEQSDIDALKPHHNLILKTKKYIHSSSISENWVCYSTQNALHIFHRSSTSSQDFPKTIKVNEKITNCHLLQITNDEKYLIACVYNEIILLELNAVYADRNPDVVDESSSDCTVIDRLTINYRCIEMLNPETNFLLLKTGPINDSHVICGIRLTESEHDDTKVKLNLVYSLRSNPHHIRFMYHNPYLTTRNEDSPDRSKSKKRTKKKQLTQEKVDNRFVWLFTTKNSLVKFNYADIPEDATKNFIGKMLEGKTISNIDMLPDIQGMAQLSEEFCILYDNHGKLYKVNLTNLRVYGEYANKNFVINIQNGSPYNKLNHVVSFELTRPLLARVRSTGSLGPIGETSTPGEGAINTLGAAKQRFLPTEDPTIKV